ncbi:MAG: hypothetical protein QOG53_2392 [Frankiales bacterium]|jgi:uncharacterized protein|nr:hypothetical protein [Frankiales bacterium]
MPLKPQTHLDPRNPLVLDTRELGRRAGSMRLLQRTVPTPAGFGFEVIGVPEGSDLTLDLRLEAVMEGVLVSGPVRAMATGECSRCLDPVTVPIEVDLVELYTYPGHEQPGDEEDVGQLVGDFIDLEPRLRDAIVLALPLRPVCSEDCPGLCATCGARLADEPPGHTHEQLDPRWSALQGLQPVLGESLSTTDEER